MKQTLFVIAILALLAAGCTEVELPRETPSSPVESYQELPK
jgi:hypothetical protein